MSISCLRNVVSIGLLICAGTFVCIPQVSMFVVLVALSAGFGFGEAVVSSSSSTADRKSTRLNSSHTSVSRMPSSA